MLVFSATCAAIALADQAGTLRLVETQGRFGPFVAICDEVGLIEVANDMAEAQARVEGVRR